MAESRTKSGQFVKKNNAEALAKAQTFTKESVLNSVAKIRSTLDGQVAEIGDLVQEKLTELETVSAAVDAQKSEAERIHGVEAIARNIDEANIAFQEKAAELARQTAEMQRNYAAQLEAARSTNAQAVQNLENERIRNQATWSYTFEQTKKAANDQLNEEIRVSKQVEKVRTEDLNRGWALREQELQARETEIVDLRQKAASFPAELDKAVNAAEGKARGMTEREKNHEIALLNNTHQAARTVDQNTITNLTAKLAEKDKLISDLSTQLVAANTKVETIATKALESAATRQQLADTQMMNQSTNGAGTGPKRA